MIDFTGLIKDLLIIIKLIFMSIFFYLEVIVKHFLLPKKHVYKNIKGNIVLITGAAGGIGKCLVKELLKLDCSIICVDINKSQLKSLEDELKREFKNFEDRILYFEVDISSTQQIDNLVGKIKNQIGSVDILINNAGIMNKGKLLVDLNEKEILNIFNVNILSQFWFCKAFLPDMISKNNGHIVNVSSSLGIFGMYKLTDYCSTKFAVYGFSEALRVELKTLNPDNQITVTTVCPFHVKTPLFNGFELPTIKWIETSVTPESVAKDIVNGILLDKEIVGCPNYLLWIFSTIKNLFTTKLNDCMVFMFGFHKGIEKYKEL